MNSRSTQNGICVQDILYRVLHSLISVIFHKMSLLVMSHQESVEDGAQVQLFIYIRLVSSSTISTLSPSTTIPVVFVVHLVLLNRSICGGQFKNGLMWWSVCICVPVMILCAVLINFFSKFYNKELRLTNNLYQNST